MRCTEDLNAYLAANWRSFSTQNYFDKNGVFMCTIVSVPLLLMAAFMACWGVYQCGGTLIDLKKKQLQHKAKEDRKGGEAGAAVGEGQGEQRPVENKKDK